MKIFILLIVSIFFFSGCSSKKPEIQYVYIPKTKYVYKTIYIPCETENKKPVAKSEEKKIVKKKSVKKKRYIEPKPRKIFAPKKYIKTPNKKMDFMIGINKDGSKFVYMEGGFGNDTYKNFMKFIKSAGSDVKEIKINSNGGLLNPALKIGAFVKDNGWDTGVDKEMRCMSACGFVYFAGKNKSIQGKAVVGLHRPYIPGVEDTVQSIEHTTQEYRSYWRYIGAPRDIYEEMMMVGRDDLFVLDRNNINYYIDVEIN